MERRTDILRAWGFWAVLAGAVGIVLVMSGAIGPTLDPAPSAATQIGEMAGEIRRSAWRSFLGLPRPAPEPVPVPIWTYVGLAGLVLGAVAIVLAVLSAMMREDRRYLVYATGLGSTAILFHFIWWMALLVAGVFVLVAVIQNIGDIFSF